MTLTCVLISDFALRSCLTLPLKSVAAMLRTAMDQGLVSASLYEGLWVDVGTPERLAQLNLQA